MVLLIDNYDSFAYNLYQFVGTVTEDIRVIRNDALTTAQIRCLNPSHIILSPGPGYPKDAGVCVQVARELCDIPLLGVCLGHQSICEAYGATISYAGKLMHGKQSQVTIDPHCPIFSHLPRVITAARYHSLAAVEATMPDCLAVTGYSDDGEIMAVMHKTYPVYGVQFHPESILTPQGMDMIANFLAVRKETVSI